MSLESLRALAGEKSTGGKPNLSALRALAGETGKKRSAPAGSLHDLAPWARRYEADLKADEKKQKSAKKSAGAIREPYGFLERQKIRGESLAKSLSGVIIGSIASPFQMMGEGIEAFRERGAAGGAKETANLLAGIPLDMAANVAQNVLQPTRRGPGSLREDPFAAVANAAMVAGGLYGMKPKPGQFNALAPRPTGPGALGVDITKVRESIPKAPRMPKAKPTPEPAPEAAPAVTSAATQRLEAARTELAALDRKQQIAKQMGSQSPPDPRIQQLKNEIAQLEKGLGIEKEPLPAQQPRAGTKKGKGKKPEPKPTPTPAPEAAKPVTPKPTVTAKSKETPTPDLAVREARVVSFEQFAAEKGVPGLLTEQGMGRYPNGISKAERKRIETRLTKEGAERAEKLAAAREEYDRLVEAGEIRPPTEAERLERTAQGHPDNESTQAAQRVLEKRTARLAAREAELRGRIEAGEKTPELEQEYLSTLEQLRASEGNRASSVQDRANSAQGGAAKEPWEMGKEEFASPPPLPEATKPGHVVAYHRLAHDSDLPGILSEGLLTSKKKPGFEGPEGLLWGAETPTGYSESGTLIAVQVPESALYTKHGHVAWWGDVPPEDILWVDKPTYSSKSNLARRISWERSGDYADAYHKTYVEDAAKEGKFGEGIKDYPDLVERYQKPTSPTSAPVVGKKPPVPSEPGIEPAKPTVAAKKRTAKQKSVVDWESVPTEYQVGDIIGNDLIQGRVLGKGTLGKGKYAMEGYRVEVVTGHEKGGESFISAREAGLIKPATPAGQSTMFSEPSPPTKAAPKPTVTAKKGRVGEEPSGTISDETWAKGVLAADELTQGVNAFGKPPAKAVREAKRILGQAEGGTKPKNLRPDEVKALVAEYQSAGHMAKYYPRKRRVSLDGFPSVSEAEAATKMRRVIAEAKAQPPPPTKAAPKPGGEVAPAPSTPAEPMGKLSQAAEAARKRLSDKGLRMKTGIDPTDLYDYSIIGAEYIAKGVRDFAEWSKAMVDEFGERIKPYLKDLYNRARTDAKLVLGETAETPKAQTGTTLQAMIEEGGTGARRSLTEPIAKQLGLETQARGGGATDAEVLRMGKEINSVDAKAPYRTARDLSANRRPATPAEMGSLQVEQQSLMNRIAQAQERGIEATINGTKTERNATNTELARLLENLQTIQDGIHSGSSALGAGLKSVQVATTPEMDLGHVLLNAQVKKGKPLTVAEADAITVNHADVVAKIKGLEQRIAEGDAAIRDREASIESLQDALNQASKEWKERAKKGKEKPKRPTLSDPARYADNKVITSERMVELVSKFQERWGRITDTNDVYIGSGPAKLANELFDSKLIKEVGEFMVGLAESEGRMGYAKLRLTMKQIAPHMPDKLIQKAYTTLKNDDRNKAAIKNFEARQKLVEEHREAEAQAMGDELSASVSEYNRLKGIKQPKTAAEKDLAAQERLRARIQDLRRRIANGEPPATRARLEYNAETIRLQTEARELLRYLKQITTPLTRTEKILRPIETTQGYVKSFGTMADISWPGRQGGALMTLNPGVPINLEVAKAVVPAIKAGASAKAYRLEIAKTMADPYYSKYYRALRKSGLDLGADEIADLYRREEPFQQGPQGKVAAYTGVAAAERAFVTARLAAFRTFKNYMRHLEKEGRATLEMADDIANMVATFSGKANLGSFAQAGRKLNLVLFAPKWVKSQFDIWTMPFAHRNKYVRRQAAKALITRGVLAASALVLAEQAGGEVEWDIRSTNFMRIRVGNTWLDPFGPMSFLPKMIVQAIGGVRKDERTGKIVPARLGERVGSLMGGKISPLVSKGSQFISKRTWDNKNVYKEYSEDTLHQVVNDWGPMIAGDIWDAYRASGGKVAIGAGAAAFGGIGVQSKEPKPAKTSSTTTTNTRWSR